MQKTICRVRNFTKEYLPKTLLIMKFLTFFLLVASLQLSARGFSQRVTLAEKNIALVKLFHSIERQTGYSFFYDESWLQKSSPVTISVKNVPLKKALEACFENQPLTHTIVGKTVVIKLKGKTVAEAPELTASSVAQPIKGAVTGDEGQALSGVSVVIEGTKKGTTTDESGNFSIDANPGDVLVFSMVGYTTIRHTIGAATTISIKLEAETAEMSDVVVVGYGTQKKADLTGAVSVVSSKQFEKAVQYDALAALQGKVAGLQIVSNSGLPGESKEIQIRGLQSLAASTSPLYVVDGTISDNITNISPSDIANITVLKDAASASIYGARSANGVIVITTKRGSKSSAPIVSFHTYQGMQTEGNLKLKLLDATQYVELDKEAYENAGYLNQSPYWDFVNDQPSDIILNQYAGINTDWLKIMRRNGGIQNYELSVRGGNDKSTFYTAVNYFKEKGRTISSSADRFNVRLNSDHKINRFLEFGNNLSIYTTGSQGISSSQAGRDAYQTAVMQSPLTRPYEADGSYGYVREPDLEGRTMPPHILANEFVNEGRSYGASGNVFLKLHILPGLTFTPRLSGDYSDNISKAFVPAIVLRNIEGNVKNSVSRYDGSNWHWIADFLLNYDRTFNGVHNISALAGYSEEENIYEDLQGSRQGTPNNNIQYLNAGEIAGASNSGGYSDWAFISQFGRLNYNYDERYLVQVSVRRDGSSRFVDENRYGVFPSYAIGWKLSKENFFQKLTPVINDFKLRASIGTLGNANVGNYPAYASLTPMTYVLNNNITTVYTLAQFANRAIAWETTKKKNFGVDLAMFRSRLTLSADYYISNTTDLLFGQPLPISSGNYANYETYNPTINGGEIRNKGFEFTLGYQEAKKDFSYGLTANFGANRSKVINLNGEDFGDASGIVVGQPMYSFYGYKSLGVIKDQATLDNYPQKDGSTLGDLWIADINGWDNDGKLTGQPDGVVDDADRTFIGNPAPDFTYGLVGNLTYKRFSFQFSLMGVHGIDLNTEGPTMNYFFYPQNNSVRILDRWHPVKNPNGNLPRITKEDIAGNVSEFSSFWLSDASYLRINNVNISYSFPESVFKTFRMKNLELYLSAQNLYTFTRFPGQEVDVTDQGQFNRPSSKVPLPRTILVGIKTSF
ncbi:MAG: TonB-dependent receptor [Chitinophagaceae bacterium]|nr:TonB-dependent receptor [Chitinophagaceae bacterium]